MNLEIPSFSAFVRLHQDSTTKTLNSLEKIKLHLSNLSKHAFSAFTNRKTFLFFQINFKNIVCDFLDDVRQLERILVLVS